MGQYTSCDCVNISMKRSQRPCNTVKLRCGIVALKIGDLIKESLETGSEHFLRWEKMKDEYNFLCRAEKCSVLGVGQFTKKLWSL